MQTRPVFCLMGPTASGKTRLALELAGRYPFEIVSVDSVQIYRGMNIGSAKPDAATLASIPHHLLDLLDPHETFSAAQFCALATGVIDEITRRGNIPLLAGGTMLYFRALQQGLSVMPSGNPAVRASLAAEAEKAGWPALHARLARQDPLAAARIHPHDAQRIQRALEVIAISGVAFSAHHASQIAPSPGKSPTLPGYEFHSMAIAPGDRAILHQRIATRFGQMLSDGLVAEVAVLRARGDLSPELPAIRSAGYRQVWAYLEGELAYAEMVTRAMIATRQLAKRQLTWLRHWPGICWFDSEKNDYEIDVYAHIDKILSIYRE